ncbi:hypothetical protein ACIP5Y_21185 [Nocardia sp. NPDC088792]|uniref:hypothetical protein n=1 Tax=Nocardia sp. NPDC088792 TaxID=3364332 RepID=UPI003825C694
MADLSRAAELQRLASLLVAISTELGEPGDTLFDDLPRLVREFRANATELRADMLERVGHAEALAEGLRARITELDQEIQAAAGWRLAVAARNSQLEQFVAMRDARIAELERMGPSFGYITGYRDGKHWQILFDGEPFTHAEAIEDLHNATTEVPDVEWHVLEVRVADERPEVSDCA